MHDIQAIAKSHSETPAIRVSLAGVDVSHLLLSGRAPRLQNRLDYPNYNEFNTSHITLALTDNGQFASGVDPNFFTRNGVDATGFRAEVRVEIGFQTANTFTGKTVFVGELISIKNNTREKSVEMTFSDKSYLLRKARLDDFGKERELVATFGEAFANGTYKIHPDQAPIYPQTVRAWQGTPDNRAFYTRWQKGTALQRVASVRSEGNLVPTNFQVVSDGILTEGGSLENNPIVAFKEPYRWRRIENLIREIASDFNIAISSGDVSVPVWQESDNFFATHGRPGWETDDYKQSNLFREFHWTGAPRALSMARSGTNDGNFYILYGDTYSFEDNTPNFGFLEWNPETDAWNDFGITGLELSNFDTEDGVNFYAIATGEQLDPTTTLVGTKPALYHYSRLSDSFTKVADNVVPGIRYDSGETHQQADARANVRVHNNRAYFVRQRRIAANSFRTELMQRTGTANAAIRTINATTPQPLNFEILDDGTLIAVGVAPPTAAVEPPNIYTQQPPSIRPLIPSAKTIYYGQISIKHPTFSETFSPGSVTQQPPSLKYSEPTLTITQPPLSVSAPTLTITQPPLSVSAPTLSISQSALSVSAPTLTITQPPLSVSAPTLTITQPPLSVSAPTLTITQPPLSVSAPTIDISQSALSVAAPTLTITQPPLSVAAPTLTITQPPLSVSAPTLTITQPPLSVSAPTIDISQSALSVAAPTLTITQPPLSVSAPTLTITQPPLSVSAPRLSISQSALSVVAPTIDISQSALSVAAPTINISQSALSVSAPTLSISQAALSVSAPTIDISQSAISVQDTSLSLSQGPISHDTPSINISFQPPTVSYDEPTISTKAGSLSISNAPTRVGTLYIRGGISAAGPSVSTRRGRYGITSISVGSVTINQALFITRSGYRAGSLSYTFSRTSVSVDPGSISTTAGNVSHSFDPGSISQGAISYAFDAGGVSLGAVSYDFDAGSVSLGAVSYDFDAGSISQEAISYAFDAGNVSLGAVSYDFDAGSVSQEAISYDFDAGSVSLGAISYDFDAGSVSLGSISYDFDAGSVSLGSISYDFDAGSVSLGAISYDFDAGSVSLGAISYDFDAGSVSLGAISYAFDAGNVSLGAISYDFDAGSVSLGSISYTFDAGSVSLGAISYDFDAGSVSLGSISYDFDAGSVSQKAISYTFDAGSVSLGSISYDFDAGSVSLGSISYDFDAGRTSFIYNRLVSTPPTLSFSVFTGVHSQHIITSDIPAYQPPPSQAPPSLKAPTNIDHPNTAQNGSQITVWERNTTGTWRTIGTQRVRGKVISVSELTKAGDYIYFNMQYERGTHTDGGTLQPSASQLSRMHTNGTYQELQYYDFFEQGPSAVATLGNDAYFFRGGIEQKSPIPLRPRYREDTGGFLRITPAGQKIDAGLNWRSGINREEGAGWGRHSTTNGRMITKDDTIFFLSGFKEFENQQYDRSSLNIEPSNRATNWQLLQYGENNPMRIPKLPTQGKSPWAVLLELAYLTNCITSFNTGRLTFKVRTDTIVYTVGEDLIMNIHITPDMENLFNRVTANYGEGFQHTTQDAASISSHGEHNYSIDIPYLTHHDRLWVERLAERYLEDNKEIRFLIDAELIWSPHLELGQAITLTHSSLPMSPVNARLLRITHDTNRWITSIQARTF